MTRPELVEAARHFWAAAGSPPHGTVPVEDAALWSFPVTVRIQHGLSIATIQRWLDENRFRVRLENADRPLRGCAVASRGAGLVFVDAADPRNERDFTVAHEVAHLVLDYYAPRDIAERLIGASGHAVFDGVRDASWEEHLAAALHGRPLVPFVHLLERDSALVASAAVLARERLADELACELLAPGALVLAALPPGWDQDDARAVLTGRFGLPAELADDYGRRLVRRYRPTPTFVDWLG